MRLFLLSLGLMLIGVWLNIVFNNYIQIGGLKINWILIFMVILAFRHSKLVIRFVGILAGLVMDALSHGIMGLYGTSFFLTLLLISHLNKLFYANTFFGVSLAVLIMSIFEGWISLSILGMFEPGFEVSSHLLALTLPLALLQGLMTPIILQFVIWSENLFLRDVA
ncbi:MAG: rod shape-determining protein MreD [SAR324 cluster bacterium]|nr:rod shape-determining protein MreD [SAR324 cluster bacterium]MED5435411.1 rod shape-determining protein MreD [SAR324 cluster bacterium]MEE3266180.1 rod shape-determining protein MreD [SAR324 cluster bacterium]